MNTYKMNEKAKMELLAMLWHDRSVKLRGLWGTVAKLIDRDQVVDDYGVALYDLYQFILPYETEDVLLFSAEDMEAFARTW